MDEKQTSVSVTRVNNGWLLDVGRHWDRGGSAVQIFVAQTPRELAALIQAWAEKQDGAG